MIQFLRNLLQFLGGFLIVLSAFGLIMVCFYFFQQEEAEHNAANAYIGRSETIPYISLHGGYGADKSYLEYVKPHPDWTNRYLIKHINRISGDRTLEIFLLEPGEKREVKVNYMDGFIIIQEQTGAELGFISANPPEKK